MVSSRGRSSYRRGNIFIGPFNYNKRESQPTRRVHYFTSGLSFVSFNLTLAEHLGRRISAQCACVIKASAQERKCVRTQPSQGVHSRYSLESLLARGLRGNLAAGLAALQEISIKVSFISTQNPLLPDGYSKLPKCSVFAGKRQSLLA